MALRPDAAARTFVLGEFGRLLAAVDAAALPPADATPEAVYARGVALVAAAARRPAGRLGAARPTIWTTRGVAATSASAGSPTRSRRRCTRWPARCCPERGASFLRVWGKPGAKGAFRVILNGS